MARPHPFALLLAALPLLASFSAFAQECRDAMAQIQAGAFDDPAVYARGRCCKNADELTKKLVAEGIPLEKIKVIYLLYEGYRGSDVPLPREADLIPAMPRERLAYTWKRHVVLEVDGKILDLDHSPKPVEAREYFKNMFPKSHVHPEGGLERHIRIRVVPAARNREEMERQSGDDTKVAKILGDRKDSLPDFPVQIAEDYLKTLEATSRP